VITYPLDLARTRLAVIGTDDQINNNKSHKQHQSSSKNSSQTKSKRFRNRMKISNWKISRVFVQFHSMFGFKGLVRGLGPTVLGD